MTTHPESLSTWRAELSLNYTRSSERTVVHAKHSGPLRVLQSLYPEGDAVCHNVLVHPPGGLVGGDTLDIALHLDAQTHALVTTPGATRFYRSEQGPRDPRTTTWYELAESGLLPESAVRGIMKYGYLRQRDLTLPWIDKSLIDFRKH